MRRTLPSAAETAWILANRRTRPPRRPPPAAGRALAKLLKPLHARFGHGVEALIGHWTEIVGQTLARRTEPTRLTTPRRGGPASLELRVQGPAATLIQHQAPDILARVNLFLGPDAVGRLRIVQGPLRRTPAEVIPPSRRRAIGPLDAAAERTLADDLASFPDGPLKQALARLGREVLREPSRWR